MNSCICRACNGKGQIDIPPPDSNPPNLTAICLDFDGVLHDMQTPWAGPGDPPHDRPVYGAKEFVLACLRAGIVVYVFSCRSETMLGVEQMKAWLRQYKFPVNRMQFPMRKPLADRYIDDRAYPFNGVFPTISFLKTFKPWNQRKPLH